MMGQCRAVLRVTLAALLTATAIIPGLFTRRFTPRFHAVLVMLYCRSLVRIFGVRLKISGEIPRHACGTLFVSNHISYLDVPIFGAHHPVRFTPKAEIRSWPVLGFLTGLTGAFYIERRAGSAKEQQEKLRAALEAGDNVLLFAEGTTSDGSHVLPFKSSLFAVVEPVAGKPEIPVRMMALAYTKVLGKPPKSGRMLDRVAWYGDMTFAPHIWALLTMRGVEAELRYFPELRWSDFNDRKALAKHCEEAIRGAVAERAAV